MVGRGKIEGVCKDQREGKSDKSPGEERDPECLDRKEVEQIREEDGLAVDRV